MVRSLNEGKKWWRGLENFTTELYSSNSTVPAVNMWINDRPKSRNVRSILCPERYEARKSPKKILYTGVCFDTTGRDVYRQIIFRVHMRLHESLCSAIVYTDTYKSRQKKIEWSNYLPVDLLLNIYCANLPHSSHD